MVTGFRDHFRKKTLLYLGPPAKCLTLCRSIIRHDSPAEYDPVLFKPGPRLNSIILPSLPVKGAIIFLCAELSEVCLPVG